MQRYPWTCAAVANVVKTSLGPRGLDKLIIQPKGDVLVTNDGATILKELEATHPCAKMVCVCLCAGWLGGCGVFAVHTMCAAQFS